MLHHFLPVLTAVAATVAVPQWWAVTPLEHVETAAEPPESPVHAFDIAAQPGEKEVRGRIVKRREREREREGVKEIKRVCVVGVMQCQANADERPMLMTPLLAPF